MCKHKCLCSNYYTEFSIPHTSVNSDVTYQINALKLKFSYTEISSIENASFCGKTYTAGIIEDELTKAKSDYNTYKWLLKKAIFDIKSNEIEIKLEAEANIKKIHDKDNAAHKLLIEKEAAAVKEVKTIEEFMRALSKQKAIRWFIEKELVACGEKIVAIEKTRQFLNQIVGCHQPLRIVKGKDAWII